MPIRDSGGSCSSSSDPFSCVRDQSQSQAICPVFRDQLIRPAVERSVVHCDLIFDSRLFHTEHPEFGRTEPLSDRIKETTVRAHFLSLSPISVWRRCTTVVSGSD